MLNEEIVKVCYIDYIWSYYFRELEGVNVMIEFCVYNSEIKVLCLKEIVWGCVYNNNNVILVL